MKGDKSYCEQCGKDLGKAREFTQEFCNPDCEAQFDRDEKAYSEQLEPYYEMAYGRG